jgi:hypothetical protein
MAEWFGGLFDYDIEAILIAVQSHTNYFLGVA